MSRLVVTVNGVPMPNGPVLEFVELTEALVPPANALAPIPLGCTPQDPEFVAFRQQPAANGFSAVAGRKLFAALAGSPEVAVQLGVAIAQKAALYIADRSPGSQSLPWETLCRANDDLFLALDGSLPLGRMVGQIEAQPLAQHFFDPPLRVLALLAAAGGAAGDTALEQWKALEAALFAPDALPCRLEVIGGDPEVEAAVNAAAAGGAAASFRYLVSADTVAAAVRDFRPHVLHVFSHGFVEPEPSLELATKSDQVKKRERGSITLDRRHFQDFRREDPSLWLVTLNCCLGAAVGDASQSLGREVVRAGVPACIAMQEPIDRRDAHSFCGHLYRALLAQLDTATQAEPPPWTMLWPKLLQDPRRRLFDEHKAVHQSPAHCKEWALPVVYEHAVPFQLMGRTSAQLSPARIAELTALREKLLQLRGELARLDPPPPGALPGIDQRLQEIDAELFAQ